MGADLHGVVLDASTRVLGVLAASPDRLLLLNADNLAAPPRTVALPATPTQVTLSSAGGPFLVAMPRAVVRVDQRTATAASTNVDADVRSVLALPDQRLAVGAADGAVLVLGADGAVAQRITGLAETDALVDTQRGVVALDRKQTAVSLVDLGQGELGVSLRAGEGATNAVADRFGRVLVTDTTGNELLAFSADPLLLRQRFPVAGAPYGIAYDPTTDLAWVTVTARNQVVGYDVAGGEPVERYRFDTVPQPDAVAVDTETGAVLVASAAGAGVQRIEPTGGRR
ncbi:MAG: hypothetical protein ABI251_06920 [Mycobacteriaceae bacterium]